MLRKAESDHTGRPWNGQERHRIRHVVEHVMAGHHVGARDLRGCFGPAAEHAPGTAWTAPPQLSTVLPGPPCKPHSRRGVSSKKGMFRRLQDLDIYVV
jgi:hypothetical protein